MGGQLTDIWLHAAAADGGIVWLVWRAEQQLQQPRHSLAHCTPLKQQARRYWLFTYIYISSSHIYLFLSSLCLNSNSVSSASHGSAKATSVATWLDPPASLLMLPRHSLSFPSFLPAYLLFWVCAFLLVFVPLLLR